jgi:hypothetical protein
MTGQPTRTDIQNTINTKAQKKTKRACIQINFANFIHVCSILLLIVPFVVWIPMRHKRKNKNSI